MNFEEAVRLACSNGWLSEQSQEFQRLVSGRLKLRSAEKGRPIYHIEDEGPEMFCLVSGVVTITVAHPIMGGFIAHIMQPGDWFGEIATLTRGSRLVTVHARTACQFVCISRSAVDDIIRDNPAHAYGFFDLMRRTAEISLRSGIDLLIQDPRERLCARMLTLGGARDHALPASPFVIPMTQEELAFTSCLSRKAVHQILNALEKHGYCALRYRVIEVLDAQALARIVTTNANGSR